MRKLPSKLHGIDIALAGRATQGPTRQGEQPRSQPCVFHENRRRVHAFLDQCTRGRIPQRGCGIPASDARTAPASRSSAPRPPPREDQPASRRGPAIPRSPRPGPPAWARARRPREASVPAQWARAGELASMRRPDRSADPGLGTLRPCRLFQSDPEGRSADGEIAQTPCISGSAAQAQTARAVIVPPHQDCRIHRFSPTGGRGRERKRPPEKRAGGAGRAEWGAASGGRCGQSGVAANQASQRG